MNTDGVILTPQFCCVRHNTVEPRYKEVGYNKTLLYNKVILLVPAPYVSLVCFLTWYNEKPDITM